MHTSSRFPKMKDQKSIYSGLFTKSFPNGMFRVHFNKEDLVLGDVSGNIRPSFLQILVEDRVKIEGNHYDLTERHILFKLNNKD
nr:translation initiation factor 1 [Pteridophyllum racemosum]